MRRIPIAACLAAALTLLGQTAAQGARLGPHPQPDYFTVNDGTSFHRFTEPTSGDLAPPPGTASQTVNRNHSITLDITGAQHYADDGFYVVLGDLEDLHSLVVTAGGVDVGPGVWAINLWFDSNDDGDFFFWAGTQSHQVLWDVSGDQYGLGPNSSSGGSLTVNDATTFYMQGLPNGGRSFTLGDLKDGDAASIDGDTLVAAWIGICCGSEDGTSTDQTATIQSLRVR